MRYVNARLEQERRDIFYRFAILETTQGKRLNKSYVDILKPEKIDTRSGDEIVADIINGAGLSFRKNEGEEKS